MKKLDGIDRVTIDTDAWEMYIRYDPKKLTVARITAAMYAAADAANQKD